VSSGRAAADRVGPVDRQLLFVVGLARSGTTALTELLSTHPEIALGMERYKRLMLRRASVELRPSLFEPARFFDFTDGLTNITPDASPRWDAYYRHLAEGYDTATYVGDKVTGVRVRMILQRFPAARVVVIVRDLVEVAASWQRRADDPTDAGWREAWDAQEAAVQWNRGLRQLLRMFDLATGRIRVVEYRTLFGDPSGRSIHGTFDWLGLPASPAADTAFDQMHSRYARDLRDRAPELAPTERDAVATMADLEAWRAALRLVD